MSEERNSNDGCSCFYKSLAYAPHIHWLWQWWGNEVQVKKPRWGDWGEETKRPKKAPGRLERCWEQGRANETDEEQVCREVEGEQERLQFAALLHHYPTVMGVGALSHSLWLADSYMAGLRGRLKQIHRELCLYVYYETFLLCFYSQKCRVWHSCLFE